MGISSVGGSLPSYQFVIQNGKVMDAETWRKQNADAIAEFGKPQQMEELFVEPPQGGVTVDVDLSKVREMDVSELKPPEGYDSLLTYVEDWSLQHFHDHTVVPSDRSGEIRLSNTSVYDFLLADKAETMTAEEWRSQAEKADMGYQVKRAQIMTNRASRGLEVDPEDLLITIGDRKLTLDEYQTLQANLVKASKIINAAVESTSRFVADQRPNSVDAANWTLDTYAGFTLLAVKKALSRSDLPTDLANELWQRRVDAAMKNHEERYDIECQIADKTGSPRTGFRAKYDYTCGVHSLQDTNSFSTEIFFRMISIDVSTDESLRQGFGEFADWYANGIKEAFRGDPWYDGTKMSAEYKEALYHLKAQCGL